MTSSGAAQQWHFDAERLGREIRSRREAAGWSTRRLAERAGLSQAYVVALERSVSSRDPRGPSPTAAVLTRLAAALAVAPVDLFASSLVSVGPHVLCVVGGDGTEVLDAAARLLVDVDVWVSAGSRQDPSQTGSHHVNLHPEGDTSFSPQHVSRSLHQDFSALRPVVLDQHVGVVAVDAREVLLSTEDEVLAIEHEWPTLVGAAVWAAGARRVTNVCVWQLDVLQHLSEPLAASLDLLSSHDTVWFSAGDRMWRDRPASSRVLQRLRPPHVRADAWRRSCDQHLDRVGSIERRPQRGAAPSLRHH